MTGLINFQIFYKTKRKNMLLKLLIELSKMQAKFHLEVWLKKIQFLIRLREDLIPPLKL